VNSSASARIFLSLRRTRSGDATLDQAIALDAIERDPARAVRAVVPLSQMLPGSSRSR